MPYHIEPKDSPVSTSEKLAEYPFIATSGGRSYEFFHSEHRQLETMREFHPMPLVKVSPQTAEEYGLAEGEWIWIENTEGRCRQKVTIDPTLNPRYIHAEHGWWFPEQDGAEPNLYGFRQSNINQLLANKPGTTGFGADLKCTLCKVYRCKEEEL